MVSLRLRKNLGEVNNKEGGEEKKAENLRLSSCIIILPNELQTKNTPKNNLHF